jgi:hypothetical protein
MLEKTLLDNVVYKYSDKGFYGRVLLGLVFLKDIYLLRRQLNTISQKFEVIVAYDTHAANIPSFAKNIRSALGGQAQVFGIEPLPFKHVAWSLNFFYFLLMQLFSYMIYNKSGAGFKDFVFCNMVNSSDQCVKDVLSSKTVIVFYEKSILSMYLKVYARRFVVMQHGIPTSTYFPSLADCYLVWNEYFKSYIADSFDGEILVVGYPGTLAAIKNGPKKYDLLFLSQRGSSSEVMRKCSAVKAKINFLSDLGVKILVKLHPSEKVSDFKYNERVDIYLGNTIEEAASLCLGACSYYSTALYLLGAVGFPVFRLPASSGENVTDVLAQIPELDLGNVERLDHVTFSEDLKLFDLQTDSLKSGLELCS